MYSIYQETDPVTAVEHSLCCSFIDADCSQLITTGKNRLRVFRTNPFVLERNEESGEWSQTAKLECLLSVNFLSPIISIASARLPNSSRDCLLLVFNDAKLSIVGFDDENYDIVTLSMHYFEEEILKGGYTHHLPSPIVRADPDNRCGAMLVFGKHLAIVPFKKDVTDFLDDDVNVLHDTSKHQFFSYCVPLAELDTKLVNVRDMAFLHGYYEPTLLLLYEPIPTTVGRLAIRHDTFCILAASLNVRDRIQAVIWTVNLLPHDCLRCQPVPKPVGGVLIVAANSLIYLNQSVPPYGVSVNGCYKDTTSFPLKNRDEKRIVLDGSACTFIQPTVMAMVLRSGHVYIVTILIDNTNAVKAIELEKAFDSVPPCSLTRLEDGVLFVGSRLAESQLLKYKERDALAVQVTSEAPAAKRSRPCQSHDAPSDALDDLALYGEVVATTTVETMCVMQYEFQLCDRLNHFGPCRQMCVGSPSQVPEPLQSQTFNTVFDMVIASGHENTGAITVLQRTVRPNIVTSSQIPGALQLWTVGKRPENGNQHEYLLVAKEVTTMVLELRDEISELETSGFVMQQRTIAAGDLANGQYIVQVAPMSVIVLRGTTRIQELPLDISFPVCRAHIVDPYVVLLTENGQIVFLQLVMTSGNHMELIMDKPDVINQTAATALCVYRDDSGVFIQSSGPTTDHDVKHAPRPHVKKTEPEPKPDLLDTNSQQSVNNDIDDEDLLLYGEPSTSESTKEDVKPILTHHRTNAALQRSEVLFEGSRRVTATGGQCTLNDPNTVEPSFWLCVARESGLLEIYALPTFECVFTVKRFAFGHRTLFDSDTVSLSLSEQQQHPTTPGVLRSSSVDAQTRTISVDGLDADSGPMIRDLCLIGLGTNGCRPHLFAVVGDDLLSYEAFPYDSRCLARLCVRFRKLPGACKSLRNTKLTSKQKQRQQQIRAGADPMQTPVDNEMDRFTQFLHTWEDVGRYSNNGVFVCGPYPYWVLLDADALRLHPMNMEGAVRSFSPFNNSNCQRGFLYLTMSDNSMRVCSLDPKFDYAGSSIPSWKVPIGETVNFVCYLLDSHTFALATSEPVVHRRQFTMVGDQKQFEDADKADEPNFIDTHVQKHKVSLYSPDDWQPIIGAGELEMQDYETITCMKEVQLRSEGTVSGLENYLALGTVHNYGEEVLVRGRIFILSVIEVVPEPGQPSTRYRLKSVLVRDEKGPVTSLCSANGFMMTALGPKIHIWHWRDNDLHGISFLDMHYYVHQMVAVRNLTLVADMYRSIALIRYQEQHKAMSVASRDLRPVNIQALPMAIDFVIDNRQIAFLMTDEDENLSLFVYQPEARESLGGQRLLLRGDLNVGTRIVTSCRVHAHTADEVVENKIQAVNRHVNIFASLDGSLCCLVPLPEKVYRRLHTLSQMLAAHFAPAAGLNPRGTRQIRGYRAQMLSQLPQYQQATRTIVDGDVIAEFAALTLAEKHEIAKRMGTSREQLIDDLLELQRMITHY